MFTGYSHIPANERRAAMLALVVSIALVGAKFFAYALSGSAAIFADALESIVNVAAASFAIYSLSLAHTPADSEHPYGHGKIEFFSGGFEGGMIVLAAILAAVNAILALMHGGLNEQRIGVACIVLIAALAVNGGAAGFTCWASAVGANPSRLKPMANISSATRFPACLRWWPSGSCV